MDAFVVRIGEQANTRDAADQKRNARLRNSGWHKSLDTPGITAFTCGRAQTAQFGPWQAIGLARLSNADALQQGDEGPDLSDIDLIARLRATDGPGFHEKLLGAFSVLLIDTDTGRVEAYRDHFGILPFYYCRHGDALTCATDIRAALHLSALPIDACALRIADFLAGKDIDPELTAFANLHRLPAAHALTWHAGVIAKDAYWTCEPPPPISPDTAAPLLREHLDAATTGAMRQSEAVGAMLSGGLDSSSLAGLAAQIRKDAAAPPLPTLSFVYGKEDPQDETPYIDAANTAFGTTALKLAVTSAPRLSDSPEVIEEQMDLFLGFGLLKSRRIYKEAADHGLSALIDGHGGDEVISHGYGRLIELAAQRRWPRLFLEIRGASRIYGSPQWAPYLIYLARHGGLAERGVAQRLLLRIARALRPAKARNASSVVAADIMATELRNQIDIDHRYAEDPGPVTQADRLSAEQIAHLRIMTDPRIQSAFETLHRSATARGILPLYPFFDRRVVAHCLAVPSDAKLRNGQTRWVLREAMLGVLPEKVRTRSSKAAFDDEFRTTVTDYLESSGDAAFDGLDRYVDPEAADRLRAQVTARPDDDVEALRLCWRLAVLHFWVRAFDTWKDLQTRGELI